MTPNHRPPPRHLYIRWLQTAALTHLLAGLLLTWASHNPLLDPYQLTIEQAFWPTPAPTFARNQQIWWQALFGATLQSYALYMLALIHLGNRFRSHHAWAWLIAGLVLWAPQDILISLQAGIWSHLIVDVVALLVLLPPLIGLYRHDRPTSTHKRT